MSENGTMNGAIKADAVDGRPAVIVYECLSGVIFHITPLNLPTLRAIQLKAQDLFPYPDKEGYEIPDPSEVAFAPGQVEPAEHNPEYIKLCQEVDHQRAKWVDKAIFNFAAKMPKYPTKEVLVEAFKPKLNDLRAIAKFDENDEDYDLILLNFVLTGNQDGISDYVRIIRLAIQAVALSPAEVATGIRFFRAKV